MELRPLGTSGVMASVIGLGAWPMGGEWWGGSDDAEWMPCRPIPICSH
jgi:aryl-alcohol dehydrogenase-like predicted oxidoreductase